MRILNTLMFPHWGGTEEMGLNYMRALRGVADIFSVVTPGTEMQDRLKEYGFSSHFADVPGGRLRPHIVRQLRGAILATSPDIILTHNDRQAMNACAAKLFARSQAPIVNILHLKPKTHVRFAADAFFAVSPGMRKVAQEQQVPTDRIQLMPNFFMNDIPALKDKSIGRPPIIGFLGRMGHEKGLDTLIDALAVLKKRGFAFKAHFGGGTDYLKYYQHANKKDVNDCISWLGWIYDKAPFFNKIDMLIVPSRSEPFGMVILEAWQHGVPVISTKTDGAKFLITDTFNGLSSGDEPEQLADSIQHLANTHGLHRGIRTQAHCDVQQWHGRYRVPKILEALSSIVADHKRGTPVNVPRPAKA